MTLPEGWVETTLSEIVTFNPKHDPMSNLDQVISFVPMPAVDEHSGTIKSAIDRPLREIWSGFTHFADGDVIFAKITPCMENGKAAVAKNLKNGMACGSTEFFVLRPSTGVQADYVWRYLRQRTFRETAETQMTGAVGQRRVPRPYLENQTFRLPPAAEQRHIVAKLDVLMARLARTRAELARVPALAAALRRQVLGDAFRLDVRGAIDLGDVVDDVRYGTAKKCDYNGGSTPVLRIPNVQRGKVDLSDVKSSDFSAKEVEKLALRRGDIIVIRSNGSLDLVGRSAVVGAETESMLYAGYLIRLRPSVEKVNPYLRHYFLPSPAAREAIARGARSTSGVNNVNAQQLQALSVPVRDLSEQEEAVALINSTFARADRLEAEATRARALLDRLEAAILARAFRGE